MSSRQSSSPMSVSPIFTALEEEHDKRYLSDVDAAEALLHMSKRPRIVKDDKCKFSLEEREAVAFQHGDCCMALLQTENRLLREEVDRLQVQKSELEEQNQNLESEKIFLQTQNKQLEANNRLLLENLEDSEGTVKRLKNELFLCRDEIVSTRL